MAEAPEKSFDHESLIDQSLLVCSSCGDFCECWDLYRCSCSITDDSVNLEDSKLLCDVCILPHIKQQHEVIDYKGYKPAFCSTHKILVSLFCYHCYKVFCFKCLGPHRTHEYIPVSEKAREIRMSVFEYLNDFDELAKPLARRKTSVQKFEESSGAIAANMSLDGFINEVWKTFDSIFWANSSKWKKLFGPELLKVQQTDPVFDIIKEADTQIGNLRGLLSMSDGVIVSQFVDGMEKFDSSLEQQKLELAKHGMVKWCSPLDGLVEACLEIVLGKWKVPVFERQPIEAISCNSGGNLFSLGSLLADPRNIVFCEITEEDVSFIEMVSDSDEEEPILQHFFQVCGVESVLRFYNLIAFVFPHNTFEILDIRTQKSLGKGALDKNLELLAFSGADGKVFLFTVWNSETRAIQSLRGESDVLWQIHHESKPKLFQKWNEFVAVVQNDNKLVVTEKSKDLSVEVLPMHHGLTRIDQIYLDVPQCRSSKTSPCRVILFDYKIKTVLISRCSLESRSELNWLVEKVFRLDGPTKIEHICMNRSESHFVVIDSKRKTLIATRAKLSFGEK